MYGDAAVLHDDKAWPFLRTDEQNEALEVAQIVYKAAAENATQRLLNEHRSSTLRMAERPSKPFPAG